MKKKNQQAYDLTFHEGTLTTTSKKGNRGKRGIPRKDSGQAGKSAWWYAGYFGDLGFTIAIPIAGGAFLGSYLDRRWSTYPKATLILLFVGVVLSIVQFIRIIREIIQTKDL